MVYCTATDWKLNTNSPGDSDTESVKVGEHCFALEPIMKDHGGSWSLLTNHDSNICLHPCLNEA